MTVSQVPGMLLPMARSRQARVKRDEAGTTLVEVIVAIFLVSLIMSFLTVFATGVLRNAQHTNTQQDDTLQARNALDAMTRSLRSAVPINTSPVTLAFSQAGSTSVTFYANNGTVTGGLTNNGPVLVHYYFDPAARTLVEETTPATTNPIGSATPYSWNASNKRVRTLAANLLNPQPTRPDVAGPQPNGGAIFSFFDRYGAAVPVDNSGAVTVTALPTVRQVEVWISVRSGNASASGVTSVVGRAQIVTGFDPDGGSQS